jgi:hypothetical protein
MSGRCSLQTNGGYGDFEVVKSDQVRSLVGRSRIFVTTFGSQHPHISLTGDPSFQPFHTRDRRLSARRLGRRLSKGVSQIVGKAHRLFEGGRRGDL